MGHVAPDVAPLERMLVGEQAFVMLLSHEKFAEFAKLPMADVSRGCGRGGAGGRGC